MKRTELVFIPAPGIGHLASTIEFVKRLIGRDDDHQLSTTVLSMKFSMIPNAEELTKSLVGSYHGRIKIIHLPEVEPLSPDLLTISPENFFCTFIESFTPHVRNALTHIVSSSNSSNKTHIALVLDFFCTSTFMDVGHELGLPSYLFFTSNYGFLCFMLTMPDRHNNKGSEFELVDSSHPDYYLSLPGWRSPVPTSVLPTGVFNKEGGYATYVKLAKKFRDTKGIIVNTFADLEPEAAVDSLTSPNYGKMPTTYMVGPVVDVKGQPNPGLDQAKREMIINWLDQQPESSVVFLCFGSMGIFRADQLREIATALERSGLRFLWSIRVPPPAKTTDEVLPEGFSERVGEKGMICGWAPQTEVLAHGAIGGFVSHCGWNSSLESLWYGVPIAAWPIYAEQQLTACMVVNEFGLAVNLKMDYREGDLVMADEIEAAVRRLMDSGSDGDELGKKVKEMSEKARKAVMEGGSSYNAVGQLINDIIGMSN
ncbi:hypothetical protein FNV43_RR17845 [Rhamnella rubrinervis]|uniref:Glycosyltransferase n=1 Tax=Rhamnella rubrinervis TaxID=2594499 RepID=A0A8K0EA66_9ROSA|nr:hypothetical protein FNV43_RR17845 [Rhamnella rubrinervis]